MLPRFIEDEGDALTIGARCRVGGGCVQQAASCGESPVFA